MSNPVPNPPQPQSKFARLSPGLIGAGVFFIALGFGLPQLVPSTAPACNPGPTPVPAAKPVEPVEPPAPIAPPSVAGIGVSLLKLGVGLVVVCALCVLLTRWIGPKPSATPGAMEVLASIAVGRCAIHLVKAGERRLLIGTDPAGVKALVELPGSVPALCPNPRVRTDRRSGCAGRCARRTAPHPTPPPATPEELLNLLLQLRPRLRPHLLRVDSIGPPPSG